MQKRQEQMISQMRKGTEEAAATKSLIPEKYINAETSGLAFTVKDGDPNQFEINLD